MGRKREQEGEERQRRERSDGRLLRQSRQDRPQRDQQQEEDGAGSDRMISDSLTSAGGRRRSDPRSFICGSVDHTFRKDTLTFGSCLHPNPRQQEVHVCHQHEIV
ncbi:hypothetical protein fugu_006566 [Takifugu bimaculatus]|uniref:Uncharacterized protein n=1 Tax=Takifugu bimaculatus TaxID=433685 RepID=A0A4Z2B413_9TELE|nr:hypothetical protein fugu_006566 [Takifugu bimaculatus]